jgi:hypothetical protein
MLFRSARVPRARALSAKRKTENPTPSRAVMLFADVTGNVSRNRKCASARACFYCERIVHDRFAALAGIRAIALVSLRILQRMA